MEALLLVPLHRESTPERLGSSPGRRNVRILAAQARGRHSLSKFNFPMRAMGLGHGVSSQRATQHPAPSGFSRTRIPFPGPHDFPDPPVSGGLKQKDQRLVTKQGGHKEEEQFGALSGPWVSASACPGSLCLARGPRHD